ncbi:lysozyme inhibitor LprI family protein [Labrenzia sp. OB1]|uniref:lysozyme inhibitor LprI family protein n=1 Tax=Labrenzia sp. OB1 TaxID=1561204 RepID=UPI0009EE959A|nr:lysozyme inhibitor LprI family protein [Labrenzia sp. OB1]
MTLPGKKTMRLLKVALIAAFSSLPLAGASAQQTAENACENAQTQLELNECSARAYQSADSALNEAYKAAMDVVKDWSPESQEKLRSAQRSWIGYRDKACLVYQYPESGSITPLLINDCLRKITTDRTDDLKALAQGLGN